MYGESSLPCCRVLQSQVEKKRRERETLSRRNFPKLSLLDQYVQDSLLTEDVNVNMTEAAVQVLETTAETGHMGESKGYFFLEEEADEPAASFFSMAFCCF